MFIRRTQCQQKKSGGHYFTYRLVESQRIGTKVRQSTLLNLGVDFSIPKEHWSILTNRITEILSGQQTFLTINSSVENVARNCAKQILMSKQHVTPEKDGDYRTVNIDSLNIYNPRSIGCEHVVLEALRSLELDTLFAKLGFNTVQAALAIGSIVGRACHPASERETHRWLQDESGIGELLGYEFSKTSLHKIYPIADQLLKNKSAIEQHLYKKERNIFALHSTITLYDLTNTYFEGQCLSNGLAKRGHSKEKRTDCPIVTLALVLDYNGFPIRSQVYEGNVSEAKTLSEMINDLQKTGLPKDKQPTVIMDAGIATEENITWLKEHKYNYLVVSRKKHREFDESQSIIVKQDAESTVKVQKVFDKETHETLLYCHSIQREKKERAIGQLFSTRFEDSLRYLDEGLKIKRRLKKYDKVMIKIGRLQQQFSKAAKLYTITVTKDKESGNAKAVKWNLKPAHDTKDTYPGVYCLRTSHTDWDESTLWKTYTMLTDLEAVFRSLKSELGLRPVHHQLADRVSGHLFISVLAYHLVHVIRTQLKQAGIHDSWTTLRNVLSSHNRSTVSMQCKGKTTVHVRKSVQPTPEQQKIYSLLNVKQHPGDVIKTTVGLKNNRCSAKLQLTDELTVDNNTK